MENENNSTQQVSSTKRIAKNTLMLYFRQILIMLVSLYTVRVVLATLGAEDYGVYNVVAGVVTMFGFLSGAMATASQRFFSFELGRGDTEKLKKTFSVTLCIYLLLILLIVLLAETVGLWFVNCKLVIPEERMTAARWIYQFSILNFGVTLITAPYMAAIIAHENMNVYAYVSIVEAALKLAVVFVLRILPYDKLIVYGILLFVVGFINTALYRGYCKKHYEECRFKPVWDGAMFKEISSYIGWNLIGNLSGIFKNQGVNIVLNQFFGPVVNAARGIAVQVNSAVNSFSQNFSTALKPQIIKTYAQKDYNATFSLVFRGCRMTFFLMLIFTVPLILNMESVLHLWLGSVPENAVLFTKLVLLVSLTESISYPMSTANQATGKVKYYQMILGGLIMMNLPVAYMLLRLGFEAYTVFVADMAIMTLATVVRMLFLYQIPGFSVWKMLKNVFFPIIAICLIIVSVFYFLRLESSNFGTLVLNVLMEVCITSLLVLFIGLKKSERKTLLSIIKNKITRGSK